MGRTKYKYRHQREDNLTRDIVKYLNDHKKYFCLDMRGMALFVRGIPDILVFIDGTPLFIEVKTLSGKPSPAQLIRRDELELKKNIPVLIYRIRENRSWKEDLDNQIKERLADDIKIHRHRDC